MHVDVLQYSVVTMDYWGLCYYLNYYRCSEQYLYTYYIMFLPFNNIVYDRHC